MDVAPIVNALKNLGPWHCFGMAVALGPVAFAVFLRGWAPSSAELTLAVTLATASGLTLGALLRWLAGTVAPRWGVARAKAGEDAALVQQLAFIGAEERGILGAFFVAGKRENYLDVTHPAVSDLRERGLLVMRGATKHRVPDAIWRAMEARPEDFPPGPLPQPGPYGWMA